MSQDQYIKDIETENAELRKKLYQYDILRDIISSKVSINIVSDEIGNIDPYNVCKYLEDHKWTMKYEKEHEKFLTRSYLSPHKDIKVKIFVKDLSSTGNNPRIKTIILAKTLDVIKNLARIHKKGELEVIYEILSGDVRN